jgi:hypothetical protein
MKFEYHDIQNRITKWKRISHYRRIVDSFKLSYVSLSLSLDSVTIMPVWLYDNIALSSLPCSFASNV